MYERRKFWGFAAAAAAALVALFAAGSSSAAEPAFDPATILVKFSDPSGSAAIVRSLGDRPLGLTLNGVEVVGLERAARVRAKLARYRALAGVVYAEPNGLARAQLTDGLSAPNDPQFGSQWAWYEGLRSGRQRCPTCMDGTACGAVASASVWGCVEDPPRLHPQFELGRR